jgi:hypothetical protein
VVRATPESGARVFPKQGGQKGSKCVELASAALCDQVLEENGFCRRGSATEGLVCSKTVRGTSLNGAIHILARPRGLRYHEWGV